MISTGKIYKALVKYFDIEKGVAFKFRPVGYGVQDFPSILEASEKAGAEWVIVEQDNSYDTPSLDAAKMSRDYLKSIYR